MTIETVGWDIGGAHLKMAAVDGAGRIDRVVQHACPLWRGLDQLNEAFAAVCGEFPLAGVKRHAVTMTGELADVFPDRREGVAAIVATVRGCLPGWVRIFAGPHGWVEPDALRAEDVDWIASANWLASGMFAAQQCAAGLLIDVGSTTTDLIAFANGEVQTRGYTDHERMRYDELLYLGILRTPVMAITDHVPFEGQWVPLMNEQFATSADVYRLTGELPESADHYPPADGGEKNRVGSARRLARMVGRDLTSSPQDAWVALAQYFRQHQIARIAHCAALQLSRAEIPADAPLIGAGIGRFLVQAVARRVGRESIDVQEWLPSTSGNPSFAAADCLPAAAIAHLARCEPWPK